MNKTAIKNFAIWARNKLIADITYRAGLLGITDKKVKEPLPSSTKDVLFFDIGTTEPYAVTGVAIEQRRKLAEIIEQKAKQSDYATAYKVVVEEVVYTWFNRLIAVRFMEVNDYLPSHIRVLSSESETKIEPDLVTTPFDAGFDFTPYENDRIVQLKNDNQLDELFRMLFIKQCNALNEILPELFETTSDYTELLLNINFTDKDGVVYRLVHDISEDDFNVAKEGQIEIIGWLYQYYNTEPKDETFMLLKKNVKITKERIPAVTQLFTPDWIVRYMVENSLGRLWLEHERASAKLSDEYLNASYFGWKYYIEDAKQESEVEAQLEKIRQEYKTIKPEDIKVIDPCMGSGHILVYAFDVLIQIYESCGYSRRDAAKSILEYNLYGLDIDNRAYQLSYFAVMMKARQYDRRFFSLYVKPNICSIQESNDIQSIEPIGWHFDRAHLATAKYLVDVFKDAKEYGSILNIEDRDYDGLEFYLEKVLENANDGEKTQDLLFFGWANTDLCILFELIKQAKILAHKYNVVVTNPPYMGNMSIKMTEYVQKHFPIGKYDLYAVFMEKCIDMATRNGLIGMITQHAWMFLSSFEKLRAKLMRTSFVNMTHLGSRAFDEISGEVVQTTTFVIRNVKVKNYQGIYINLTNASSQSEKSFIFLSGDHRYISNQEKFRYVPGYTFAYWIKDKTLCLFSGKKIADYSVIKSGIVTGSNDRFLKLWQEISIENIGFEHKKFIDNSDVKWVPMHKGGGYRKHFGLHEYVMNLHDIWEPSKTNISVRRGDTDYYFRQGLTWSTLANDLSVRISPTGFVFDTKGSMCFVIVADNMYYIEALLNSCVASFFMSFLSPTLDFNQGAMGKMPVIIDDKYLFQVDEISKWNYDCSKNDWDSFEISWNYKKHPLLYGMGTIGEAFKHWQQLLDTKFNQLKCNESKLNQIFINIYDLRNELNPEVADKDVTVARIYDTKEDIPESMKGNNYVLTKSDVIKSFISYAVGCIFGRYSLDVDGLAYAGGQWDDSKYNTLIPDKDNVLPVTDEEYFEDDIVGLFVAFVKKVYGTETLEENLDFIAEALGNKGDTSREVIRNYFLRDFFKDHCKTYKKRPIYWLFDSGKADGFKALIYMHRYNKNTIGDMRIDYLHRMQRVYESEIARMQETINNSTNAREVTAAEKRKEKLIKQLKETKDYDEKIAHLALARNAIDLDDGVKVNYEKVQTGTDGKKLDVLAKI